MAKADFGNTRISHLIKEQMLLSLQVITSVTLISIQMAFLSVETRKLLRV